MFFNKKQWPAVDRHLNPISERHRDKLGALSPDTASKLDILGHDGHAFGTDVVAEVDVFKQTHEVVLDNLLKLGDKDGRSLEAEVALEVLSNLAHKTLEEELTDEQIC